MIKIFSFIILLNFAKNILGETDHCATNPCLNGGSCISSTEGYLCECSISFSGNKCQIRTSYCDSNLCLNGGSCYYPRMIDFNKPSCFCQRKHIYDNTCFELI